MASNTDDEVLNASIKEQRVLRIGLTRTFIVFFPCALIIVAQPGYFFSTMLQLPFSDAMILYVINALIGILGVMFAYIVLVNDKGKEQASSLVTRASPKLRLFQIRQSELMDLQPSAGGKGKKGKGGLPQSEDDQKKNLDAHKAAKQLRYKILADINYESTMFGVWVTNLVFVLAFLFFSFIMLRYWTNGWNYTCSTILAAITTVYTIDNIKVYEED